MSCHLGSLKGHSGSNGLVGRLNSVVESGTVLVRDLSLKPNSVTPAVAAWASCLTSLSCFPVCESLLDYFRIEIT